MHAHVRSYLHLTRLNKPIGIFLLLWPTYWALWLASLKHPNLKLIIIFTLGVILMRSAGCIINDIADQELDKHVKRTQQRPLANNSLTSYQAYILCGILLALCLTLTLLLNRLCLTLSIVGLALTCIYPFCKRYLSAPQGFLGVTFSWGILMAYAATQNHIPRQALTIYIATIFWVFSYDTQYAMVDRDDDIKIGIRSSAILFGKYERLAITLCQCAFITAMTLAGIANKLQPIYFISIVAACLCFIHQHKLTKKRDRDSCFSAFIHNHWVGLILFLGIALSKIFE